MEPLTTTVQITDAVVGKGFEWYFIALLIIGLVVSAIFAKYGWTFCQALMSRVTILEDARANDLKADKKELVTIVGNCSEALNRNSEAFLELSTTFKDLQNVIQPKS